MEAGEGSTQCAKSIPPRPRRMSFGAVAQLGERLNRTQEVRGSIPLGSTLGSATLAQLVEHVTRNDGVVGSNPTGGSVCPLV